MPRQKNKRQKNKQLIYTCGQRSFLDDEGGVVADSPWANAATLLFWAGLGWAGPGMLVTGVDYWRRLLASIIGVDYWRRLLASIIGDWAFRIAWCFPSGVGWQCVFVSHHWKRQGSDVRLSFGLELMSDISKNADNSPIRVVIGLGNPGREYEGTRHNVGFDIVELMASNAGVGWQKERKWQALVARLGSVVLVKPQTFMNLSGQTAAYIGGFFKIPPSQILVVYDDADLPLGALRFRANGSAGGHNGIKSMIQSLGSDRFPRLKFGIGHRPAAAGEVDPESANNQRQGSRVGHVLGRFAVSERQELEKSLAIAVDAVNCALVRGLAAAMNQFNQKPSKPKKAKRQRPPRTSPEPKSSEADATVNQKIEHPSIPDNSTPEAAPENHPNPES